MNYKKKYTFTSNNECAKKWAAICKKNGMSHKNRNITIGFSTWWVGNEQEYNEQGQPIDDRGDVIDHRDIVKNKAIYATSTYHPASTLDEMYNLTY